MPGVAKRKCSQILNLGKWGKKKQRVDKLQNTPDNVQEYNALPSLADMGSTSPGKKPLSPMSIWKFTTNFFLPVVGADEEMPKYHCELNFIEQCWGHAKRVYRQFPATSKEEDLEKNLLTALESVPLNVMRKYAQCSRKFMDAYYRGLTGKEAAWASKKYCGHRVLPESLMDDLAMAKL